MNAFSANAPVSTPVFSRSAEVRSISVAVRARATYAATSARRSAVVMRSTSGCSGASTMKVAPWIVSGRVVKNSTRAPSWPTISNDSCAPSERPIQFVCITFTRSGQSSPS